MKNKILGVIIFLCFAPIYSMIDNYEDLISHSYYNTHGIYFDGTENTIGELGYFKQNNYQECLGKYDGSNINARFIPFGTFVTTCSDDFYFHLFGFIKLHFKFH